MVHFCRQIKPEDHVDDHPVIQEYAIGNVILPPVLPQRISGPYRKEGQHEAGNDILIIPGYRPSADLPAKTIQNIGQPQYGQHADQSRHNPVPEPIQTESDQEPYQVRQAGPLQQRCSASRQYLPLHEQTAQQIERHGGSQAEPPEKSPSLFQEIPEHEKQQIKLYFHHDRPERPVYASRPESLQEFRRVGDTRKLHRHPQKQGLSLRRRRAKEQNDHNRRQNHIGPQARINAQEPLSQELVSVLHSFQGVPHQETADGKQQDQSREKAERSLDIQQDRIRHILISVRDQHQPHKMCHRDLERREQPGPVQAVVLK